MMGCRFQSELSMNVGSSGGVEPRLQTTNKAKEIARTSVGRSGRDG